jgi:dipeptidyl aminopeptidase/acylaminoacyl peptidase
MRNWLLSGLVLFFILPVNAQDAGYQKPPKQIQDLVEAPLTPAVRLSPDGKYLLLLAQQGYPSIAELAQPELRLAGLRINPAIHGGSRVSSYTGIELLRISNQEKIQISGLPAELNAGDLSWSPDGKYVALTNTVTTGIELWVVSLSDFKATKLTDPVLNDVAGGTPFQWIGNTGKLICKMRVASTPLAPTNNPVPSGPTIQANEGKIAPSRTYQDLLKNPGDEVTFSYFMTVQLHKIDVLTGEKSLFGTPDLISEFTISPDGNYVLITTLRKPFSYLIPYYGFGQTVGLYDNGGKFIKTVAELSLAEDVPVGFDAVPMGPRDISWRPDKPASLYWVEAQDEGNPKKPAAIRDRLHLWDAPFSGNPVQGPGFTYRFRGVLWGNDALVVFTERWWKDRREITTRWSPNSASQKLDTLFDRQYEDRSTDPGNFQLTKNAYGRNVLLTGANQTLYLSGLGNTVEGYKPFLDSYSLQTRKKSRLWESSAPWFENVIDLLDLVNGVVLLSRENAETPANYYLKSWKTGKLTQLTQFPNPFIALQGIQKELVRYKRTDGLELTGTLYLPKGYQREKDGPLPTFMWAYPREFKSADAASQVTGSPYQFSRPNWGSPIYWVTQGYAVLDNFSMPILAENDKEPNDAFVNQLTMNAEAAINKLVEIGVTDRKRIAVGGHSYGAFMTANLLAHTDLFAAGIARSGAYNRTLTPFGFQAEERTYWEAPEVYFKMSPFNYADKIKEPILLIHGEADNNSGTFPIQSERFYAALKGHGATAKLVFLPHESHGYQAKESILHMLYETSSWLDKQVKNRPEKIIRP